MTLYKLSDSKLRVPLANSSDNNTTADVVGNKNDIVTTETIYGTTHQLREHVHGACLCYPTLFNGIYIVSNVAAWTIGDATTILSASTVGSIYDIHFVNIETISANAQYELILYYGAGATECGRVRFARLNNNESANGVPIMTPLIPANSALTAKLACSTGGSSCNISIFYHTYS